VYAIAIDVGAELSADAKLKLAARRESVQVHTTAPAVQTENATMGLVLDTREIEELPLVTRNPFDLAFLATGAEAEFVVVSEISLNPCSYVCVVRHFRVKPSGMGIREHIEQFGLVRGSVCAQAEPFRLEYLDRQLPFRTPQRRVARHGAAITGQP
jgi:hypothetical protein